MVLGIGAGATAIAAVIVGRFAGRLGLWRALIIALIAGALFRVPQALVSTVGQLVLFRALASFFIGGAMPVVNAIIAENADREHQGAVYGLNLSLVSTGGAIGPVIGSAVAIIDLRLVFIATAVVLAISAVLVIVRNSKMQRT
jgi:DHA1 family multidrug resistance protein-like MFS transporter